MEIAHIRTSDKRRFSNVLHSPVDCSDEDIHREAKRWNVLEKIRFGVECLGAEWSDDTCLWTVRLKNRVTGEEFVRKCRILVSAVGIFGVPKDLDVPGWSTK